MGRIYGLRPRDLRRLTIPELDAYRADLGRLTERGSDG
jgi:hypothetical protein